MPLFPAQSKNKVKRLVNKAWTKIGIQLKFVGHPAKVPTKSYGHLHKMVISSVY